MKVSIYKLLGFLLFFSFYHCQAWPRYKFVVKEAPYTRLCSTKNILTVNGQFPGPTLYVNKGDTIVVDVYNRGNYNITIHWHGVKQPRNPWSDGPEYITQCAIQPGAKFSTWLRATVHGALIIYPKIGTTYPFPKPDVEIPIILGEWWKEDIMQVYLDLERYAGLGVLSDAYLINGQPGDLYPCSKPDNLFFAIANHTVTMVGSDASYLKPFNRTFICLTPCQTVDILLEANQNPNHYYMAASVYTTVLPGSYNNSTITSIVEYNGNYTPSSPPVFPYLPEYNETEASINFAPSFRSLADKEHPIDVPMEINTHLFYTLSLGSPCENNSCPAGEQLRFITSVNNEYGMHCHIDRHMVWGMGTAFIVKDGESPEAKMLPPPPDMPPC
ncbi:hypothetical protein SLE2022_238900 [Rubroshorea leprosula]